ncbi:Uncharacterized protein dnl_60340 [Desulfonema limicola]|uniref:Uncharacterized protein n=1 Tax=Desulfonema limicola TaxID=45656 RepID=A0A975GJE1_9BACT|nr:hypothetical protein [Desulfonema limicola]QTA83621.1 Uncharacterized protein dnl_60340 [Desulfonema limicola]
MKTQNQSPITQFLSNPAMTAYEFETEIHNGMIKIPDNFQISDNNKFRVILLSLMKSNIGLGHVKRNPLGLFIDDAELMDQITESAMKAREQHPLRSDDE